PQRHTLQIRCREEGTRTSKSSIGGTWISVHSLSVRKGPNPHISRLYSAVRPLPTSNPLLDETKKKVVLVVVVPQPSKT
ncbi:hypothetical protein A2U01_0092873, partial [Trifolium medium]|nr:hypothetical protein [Trifolium medium]